MDCESWADTDFMMRIGITTISVCTYKWKGVSGTDIPEPPINPVTDNAAVIPEQRQLPVINTVPSGHIRSCHLVVENVAPIYHSLCHQFSCTPIRYSTSLYYKNYNRLKRGCRKCRFQQYAAVLYLLMKFKEISPKQWQYHLIYGHYQAIFQ